MPAIGLYYPLHSIKFVQYRKLQEHWPASNVNRDTLTYLRTTKYDTYSEILFQVTPNLRIAIINYSIVLSLKLPEIPCKIENLFWESVVGAMVICPGLPFRNRQ